jgi:hypothetical protein
VFAELNITLNYETILWWYLKLFTFLWKMAKSGYFNI